jgi:hypothetical protein
MAEIHKPPRLSDNALRTILFVAGHGVVLLEDLAAFQHQLPPDNWDWDDDPAEHGTSILPGYLAWEVISAGTMRRVTVRDILVAYTRSCPNTSDKAAVALHRDVSAYMNTIEDSQARVFEMSLEVPHVGYARRLTFRHDKKVVAAFENALVLLVNPAERLLLEKHGVDPAVAEHVLITALPGASRSVSVFELAERGVPEQIAQDLADAPVTGIRVHISRTPTGAVHRVFLVSGHLLARTAALLGLPAKKVIRSSGLRAEDILGS